MFLEVEEKFKGKNLKKLFIFAKEPDANILKRRAREIFPQAEIEIQSKDHYLAFTQPPQAQEIKKLEQKLSQLNPEQREQGYGLIKKGERVFIYAETAPGLYYGLLSLKEALESEAELEVIDAPSFIRRGFLQDLSRGQVLNLAGFERLIHLLSQYRYNFLTFNIEHTIQSHHFPDLARDDDVLLQEEARVIYSLAKEHFIEIVPMQQSLGHLRGILINERYQALAFDPNLLWSLDPRNEDIYLMLADLYAEQAELFPGEYFLVGCDEPFDLKKKWVAELNQGKEFDQIYLEHLLTLRDILAGMKRKMMVWGDVLLSYPHLIDQLPDDVIILNWQYGTDLLEDEEYYRERSQPLIERGRKFYPAVCTWSLGRIFPELKTARANIKNFLSFAKKCNCQGALLTNWGDLGHIQLLGWIVLPIAYFGVMSWKGKIKDEDFDEEFSEYFFNDSSGNVLKLQLLLDEVNNLVKVAPGLGGMGLSVFFDELLSKNYLPLGTVKAQGERLRLIANQAGELFVRLLSSGELKAKEFLFDLEPVLVALHILARKLLIKESAPFLFKSPSKREELIKEIELLIFQTEEFEASFSERWKTQAKPKGLNRLRNKISQVELGYLKRIRQIQRGEARTWKELRDSPEFVPFQFNLLREMGLEGLL